METCFKKQELNSQQVRTDLVVHKPKFACYGFNAPGMVRANYPNCNKKINGSSPVNVSFNILGLCIGRKIPVVNVELFGVPGQAYFDSGAKTSVASSNLKRIIDFNFLHIIPYSTIQI